MKVDWQEVVEREPKGYVELNDGKTVIHGPIESICIDRGDNVEIKLKWAAKMTLTGGLPNFDWRSDPDSKVLRFPNLIMPFEIEEPNRDKGPRVRFGTNLLYINDIPGLNPKKVLDLVV